TAPLLAEEAGAARRRDLEDRRLAEFAFGYGRVDDGEVPAEPDTSAAVAVPFGAEALRRGWPQDRLLVDQQAGVVWSLTYNGADGDDWSRNNSGPYVAWRQPLTPRRAEVIRALREEYELATWKSELRIEPAAARRLLDAGWDYRQAWLLWCFALSNEADAAAFLARSREDWDSAGWLDGNSSIYRHRVSPVDAARLADAGVSYAAMCDLHEAGHTTIEQQIAATPPDVPDTPGRIILRPHRNASRLTSIKVTTDPELARQWMSTRRTYWWPGALWSTPPVSCPSMRGAQGHWVAARRHDRIIPAPAGSTLRSPT
ncbi:hypothetical protein, partial [Amycolatopsis lurida]|uniref:hypothetical protein n=1 Tax=Amycolatopsis lurida TaxID=31959 RepID=UPI00365B5CEB